MIPRLLELPDDHSFFLFGARGTGKSTLIFDKFNKQSLVINLLDPELEDLLRRKPNRLKEMVLELDSKTHHVIIDEVQKLPKLLDLVHLLIETTDKKFILTGSSARKLKQGHANLLAGRAFTYNLYPFSCIELDSEFHLGEALEYGLLPKIYNLKNTKSKNQFLRSYAQTYLKEEIWAEQFIKDLDPFRYFLEVAAQMNGKEINFSNISRDVGVDDKTIKKYFSILEDTMLGFFLNGFQHSFRKRLSTKPKFYLFDTGIKRALDLSFDLPLKEGTSAYGDAFEHFIILEIIKLSAYYHPSYKFSYLRTKDNAEVDLIVERPRQKTLFIEIKSSRDVSNDSLKNISDLSKDFENCEALCFAQEKQARLVEHVRVLPWKDGLKEYFI
jgi:predicted AAA+ superfamily ATPase